MDHESLLVVSARGECIGKVIHHNGDETFLVERGTVFPKDFEFHYESSTGVSEDGALVYTLTEYSEEPAATTEAPTASPTADVTPPARSR
jgi:hypothetical protein